MAGLAGSSVKTLPSYSLITGSFFNSGACLLLRVKAFNCSLVRSFPYKEKLGDPQFNPGVN
jgi:hypothetical protein